MKDLRLEKQAKLLADKGSWIRQGLKSFLIEWKDVTGEDIVDFAVQHEDFNFSVSEEKEYGLKTFYLERGRDEISFRHYEASPQPDDYCLDIDTVDMECLRGIIGELPEIIIRHSESLKKANKEYEKILRILNI